jgi:hypothetical protein
MDFLTKIIGCAISCLGQLPWWMWLVLPLLGAIAGLLTLLASIALGLVAGFTAWNIFWAIVGGIFTAFSLSISWCMGKCLSK